MGSKLRARKVSRRGRSRERRRALGTEYSSSGKLKVKATEQFDKNTKNILKYYSTNDPK